LPEHATSSVVFSPVLHRVTSDLTDINAQSVAPWQDHLNQGRPHMDLNAQKRLLLDRRAELTGELSKIEDSLDDPMPKDWEDRATERQGDEVLEALGNADLEELRRIDAALDRIEAGSYGTCAKCGDPISDERLQAVPTAALCRNCA
jgi:RNA polymerase-binding transcription factor DksA